MDDNSRKTKLERLKGRVVDAIKKAHAFLQTRASKVHAFLQTPFGATAGGGIFVVLVMKVFG